MQYHRHVVAASYVLDTDVMVAALRSDRGASRQLLLAALNQRFELLLSVPLILKYEAVLTRPQHLAACGLSTAEVGRVLDDLAAVARPVRLAFRWRPRLSDPDDDMVLETAINGSASAIVTFNQRDFAPGTKGFGCAVILPATALQQIRSFEPMRRSNFALRLQPSLLEELRKAAELEGVALNHRINVAVAIEASTSKV